jgi:hypothetical protein
LQSWQGFYLILKMKILYLIVIFFISFPFLFSQKHDYVWVTGHANQFADSITGYGGNLINFNQIPVKTTFHKRKANMYTTNASICDTSGNLLFYTNGCDIFGSDDEILENGEVINPGSLRTIFCIGYNDGYSGRENSVILPLADTTGIYYLFHKRYLVIGNDAPCDVIFKSIVDMNANNGKGRVISKNIPIISDTLSNTELVAVKHANGKDWWLLTPQRNSNEFYILKFTKDGIVDTLTQTIGNKINPSGAYINESQGQMVFSPDGTKLFRTARYEPVMVYDFNRETGLFINADTIHYDYGDQFVGEVCCAVSPSGQYLYLSCRTYMYQLDLWADDISASQVTVGEWDGFTTPIPTQFWACQLAPDCKIYALAGGDTRYWHVIHNPNSPGPFCNLEQRGLVLPTRCGSSMPSNPNYRLGPIDNPGLPCSGTVSSSSPVHPLLDDFSVFPNPVGAQLTVVRNRSVATRVLLSVSNALGQVLVHKELGFEDIDNAQYADLGGLVAGAYFYSLREVKSGLVLKSGVLVKE